MTACQCVCCTQGCPGCGRCRSHGRTVEVPRWALLALLDGGRLCSVCLGTSPVWDGHDSGCEGHAKQLLRTAARGDSGAGGAQ